MICVTGSERVLFSGVVLSRVVLSRVFLSERVSLCACISLSDFLCVMSGEARALCSFVLLGSTKIHPLGQVVGPVRHAGVAPESHDCCAVEIPAVFFLAGTVTPKVFRSVGCSRLGLHLLGEPPRLPAQQVHGEAHPVSTTERLALVDHDPDCERVPIRR